MSSSSISLSSAAGAPISVTGLASGLETSAIVAALMDSAREPVTNLTSEETETRGQESSLRSVQSSLQQLSFAVQEFSLGHVIQSSQSVTSSAPALVTGLATGGAGEGGYELEVTQLARAAQRTYSFATPAAEETLTIGGRQYALKAGESLAELAQQINSDHEGGVYAAPLEGSRLVLSSRSTGASSGQAITVSGAALSEVSGSAREGADAEFKVDGIAESATSNTVTDAIPGVTLTLTGITGASAVTIDVGTSAPSVSAVEGQLQSFVKLYNSTVEAIGKQLSTRPPSGSHVSQSEMESGRLYEDQELSALLDDMRRTMYEPIAGLPEGLSSPAGIGLSTGAPTGSGGTSQAALEGQLKLETPQLAQALQANPEAVQEMLQKWSLSLQKVIGQVAEPGGGIDLRLQSDEEQVTNLGAQISSMNEVLLQREHALQETYAELEAVIARNTAQSNWLASQEKVAAEG